MQQPTLEERIRTNRLPAGLLPAGSQAWRHLLFLHWPVPVERLRPLVPASLEIDTYDGTAYVGLVPFLMQNVRMSWMPKRLGLRLLETNVRTYVHDQEGRAPGVYFFSLDAESLLAVLGARAMFGLPYFYSSMAMAVNGDETRYTSRRHGLRKPSLQVRYRVGEPLGISEPGSIQFWFLERYLLYVERRGLLYSARVAHPPYPAHKAEVLRIRDELLEAAGLPAPEGMPAFSHYSPGVDVEVYGLQRAGSKGGLGA